MIATNTNTLSHRESFRRSVASARMQTAHNLIRSGVSSDLKDALSRAWKDECSCEGRTEPTSLRIGMMVYRF